MTQRSMSHLVDVGGGEEPELELHAVDQGHGLYCRLVIPGVARVSPHHPALLWSLSLSWNQPEVIKAGYHCYVS